MPLHDRYLRVTPYERIFPDDETRERVLDAIESEVEERGAGGDDPGAFALLGQTRRALAELRDPETADDGGYSHAILFFHAYHLRLEGEEHLLATVPVSRWAVEGAGAPEREGPPPSRPGLPSSVYVQLPQHLFWVREDPEERPLSLDGFFWTVNGDRLDVLGVVDFHPEGGAIRVLALPSVPYAERGIWLSETMRDGGGDFRSHMPGADLEGLYELHTAGELLKLAARLERFAQRFPGSSRPGPAPGEGADGPAGGTTPYRRLILD